MYSVYATNTGASTVCIFNDTNPTDSTILIDPVLTLEDSCAGSFKFTMTLDNAGYDYIQRMTTTITVKKDGNTIWEGRALSEDIDFWRRRTVTCEGAMAYLNDTVIPNGVWEDQTVNEYFTKVLIFHNIKVANERKILPGIVTVTDPNVTSSYATEYTKPIEEINKLIELFGGHMRMRYESGNRYLDYFADYPTTSSQVIQFGSNLMDFTQNFDLSELCTVIIPLGKQVEAEDVTEESDRTTEYVTIGPVHDDEIYLVSEEGVENFGWLEKVIKWEDIETPAALLEKAEDYLTNLQFDEIKLTVSAFDLHYISSSTASINLLDEVRCLSSPHGLDRYFPCSKIELNLAEPDKTKYSFGETKSRPTLTEVNNQVNQKLIDELNRKVQKGKILIQAAEDATNLINNATRGYITIIHNEYGAEELLITDVPVGDDPYDLDGNVWRWNLNGLGFSSHGYDPTPETYDIAITMDGKINASMVLTGTMIADRIRGGELLIGGSGLAGDGSISVYDEHDVLEGVIDSDGIHIYNGVIELGDNFYADSEEVRLGCFYAYTSGTSGANYLATDDRCTGMGNHEIYRFWTGSNEDNPEFVVNASGQVKCSAITDTGLIGNRVLISTPDRKISEETNVTVTELGYLAGARSNLQQQIDAGGGGGKKVKNLTVLTSDFVVVYEDNTHATYDYTVDSEGRIVRIQLRAS